MLYEYALEPALLSNWKDFLHFTEKFGFSEGRLISRFPKRWKGTVHDLLSKCDVHECSEMQLKRVEELLFREDSDGRTFDDRMLARQHEWNPEKDWLTNAEIEHGKRPFRAILAKENLRSKDFVLEGNSIEDGTQLFQVEKMPSVPRSADEMANLVGPVLRYAKEILLIDPHFGPENKRHRCLMEKLLAAAIHGRDGFLLERVEIHTSDKADADFFQNEALRQLPRRIPKGMKVRLFRWPENFNERFHNRFILTDRGGLSFGDGLDVGKGEDQVGQFGKETETYLKQWQLYRDDSRAPEVEVIGTSTQQRRKQAH